MTTKSIAKSPAAAPALGQTPAPALGHSMKPRQLTMMGLGSAIGAGLFLGSGAGIQAAGPAVLISYIVAGTLIILVMWALGEMAAANPNSGAFSVYAQKAMGKTAGATIGWLWWLQLVVVIAAEALGAAALLFTVWPVIPVWALSLIFMALFTAVNLAGVKNFGEFEFWFAILKVAAILLFLAIGAALLLGWLPEVPSPGLSNFTSNFAPAGLGGIATALFVVIFAFGGTEIVSVAAAETENPQHSVAQAIRTVVWRILALQHRLGIRHRSRPALNLGGFEVPLRRRARRRPHPGCRRRDHPRGRRRAAVRPECQPLRRVPHGRSPPERGEAPRFLSKLNAGRVPVLAVSVSVAFGFLAAVLELLFPRRRSCRPCSSLSAPRASSCGARPSCPS